MPSLHTNNFIKEITTITITTVAIPCTTITKRNHVALYIIIGKNIAYKIYERGVKKVQN